MPEKASALLQRHC